MENLTLPQSVSVIFGFIAFVYLYTKLEQPVKKIFMNLLEKVKK